MQRFKGKVALVTGGNSGIGYATATDLIGNGATVIITGRRKEAVEEAALRLGAIPFHADQSSVDHTNRLYEKINKEFGKLDILFINAGITGTFSLIEEATERNFDEVMNINFRGAYFTLSKLIPLLSEGASVVILSSNVVNMHRPYSSIYQASKAALNSIAKTAAAELAARKIRVNIVSPGPTKTEVMYKAGMDTASVDSLMNTLADKEIPLRKIGAPEDVAELVSYLSDEAASFITGAEFVIDGGMIL